MNHLRTGRVLGELGADGVAPTRAQVAELIERTGATLIVCREGAAEALGLPGAGDYQPTGVGRVMWTRFDGSMVELDEADL